VRPRRRGGNVPQVAPSTSVPDDYQHIDARPEAFGAGLAEGAQAMGQGLIDTSKFYGRVAADNATNNTLKQVGDILHGQPGKTILGADGKPTPDTGFLGLRGADAMNAWGDTQTAIDQAIAENRKGLKTPQAQYQYDVDTRKHRAEWLRQIGGHADEQQRFWAEGTNLTSGQLALNAAARTPTDDATVAQATESLRRAYVQNAHLFPEKYGTPALAQLKADQDIALARLRSLIGNNDGAGAERVFEQSRGVLGSLPNYDQISHLVQETKINSTMAPAVEQFVGGVMADAAGSVGGAALGRAGAFNIGNVKTREGAFAEPASAVDGVTLAANNLRGGYRGLTLSQIADKWAPTSDGNNPAQWAATVAQVSGLPQGQVPNLDDAATLHKLISGIGAAEKGRGQLGAFSPQVIDQGIQAALSGKSANLRPTFPSAADAINTNTTAIEARAWTTAEKPERRGAVLKAPIPDAADPAERPEGWNAGQGAGSEEPGLRRQPRPDLHAQRLRDHERPAEGGHRRALAAGLHVRDPEPHAERARQRRPAARGLEGGGGAEADLPRRRHADRSRSRLCATGWRGAIQRAGLLPRPSGALGDA
jgi:hypothetical protein